MTLPTVSQWSYDAQVETGYAQTINGIPYLLVRDHRTGATTLQRVRILDQPMFEVTATTRRES